MFVATELNVVLTNTLTVEPSGSEDGEMRYCVTIKPRLPSGCVSAEEDTVLTGFGSLDDAIRGAEVALAQRTIGRYTYDVVDMAGRIIDLPWQVGYPKAD